MSEFGQLNLDDLAGENARLNTEPGTAGGGFLDKFIQIPDPKPGKTIVFPVRILPPAKGAKLFQYTRLHMLNGRKYHCPKPLTKDGKWDRNTKCVVCDYYNGLYRQKDKLEEAGRKAEAEKLEAEARNIKPIERYYYNVIARKVVTDKGEEKNVGPKILSVGKVLHKMIVRAIVGDENVPPIGNVVDVKGGYDFIIMKEIRGVGKDGYPNYDRSSFDRAPSPAGTVEEIKQWVENLHVLAELRQVKEGDVMEKQLAIHRGLIPDDSDNQTFNVDEFDSKWNGGKTSTSVSVPRNLSEEDAVNAAVNSASFDEADAPTPETAPAATAPAEDIPIEDEDFLKELAEMEE